MSGEMESAPGVVKSHVCPVCSRAFSRLSALRRHTTDVCAAQAHDAMFVKFDDDDDDDDEIDEEIIAKIDAYDDADDDANDYVADAHGSAKRRRRSAAAATTGPVAMATQKKKSAKKRSKSSTPAVRRATLVSVATPSSNRNRVLDERVDGSRVHDEYDGRELYAPYDAARLRPANACLVCRQVGDADVGAMVQCNICTVKVHPLCVPVWHRSDSIDFRKPQRAKDLFFVCMDCVRCLCCGARDAGAIDTARWRDSFRFCESCWQLQGALNFCSLCCLYYRADAENMVQCELCDFWIHSECDDISALKYDAMAHRDELYVCRLCRQRADYNKRLARVIKIKLLIAATPEDDTADVQAALDDVDRQLFAPFQPVYVSDDDNEKANDDDDASDVDNGSKRGGRSRRRKRPNVSANRSAVVAAAAASSAADTADEQQSDDADDSFEMPLPDAVATGPRLVPPRAREFEAEFQRTLVETSSYSEFARRRTYNFVETSQLDASLCCFCGASAPSVRCAGCAEAFHWFCINPSAVIQLAKTGIGSSLLPIDSGEWRCATCKLCTKCGSGEQDAELVVCDWCDCATHTFCLETPFEHGEEPWACASCSIAVAAASTKAEPTTATAVESTGATTTAATTATTTDAAATTSDDMTIASYVAAAKVEQQLSQGVTVAPGTPGLSSKLPPPEVIDRMVTAMIALAPTLAPASKQASRRLAQSAADDDDDADNASAVSVACSAPGALEDAFDNVLNGDDGDGDDDDDDDDRLLAAPMKPEADVAVCALCRLPVRLDADANSDVLQLVFGRALPVHCGARVAWVHAQCGLWAPEAEELVDGRLLNVDAAMLRCPRLKCAHCLRPGASVGCTHGSCQRCFHLPCAVLSRCGLDPTDRTLRCLAHRRDRPELKDLLDDPSPRATQLLVRLGVQNLRTVDMDHTLVTTVNKAAAIESDLLYESVDAEADAATAADCLVRCKLTERTLKSAGKVVQPCLSTFLRFGELTVASFGSLAVVPAPLLPPHTPACLFPVGYVAFRHFWSVRGDRIALYCFRILSAVGAPEQVASPSLADWTARCTPVRFCVDEMSSAAVQLLARSSTVLNNEELARRLASKSRDALFGAAAVIDVDSDAQPAPLPEAGRGCRFVGSSLEHVWAYVCARTAEFRRHGAHALSAADMFGLTALPVVYHLERLPAAERCIYYRFRTRFAPLRLQLPSAPFRPPKPAVVPVPVEVDSLEAEMAAAIENGSARTAGLALVLANRRRKGQQHARGLRQAAEDRVPGAAAAANDDDAEEAAARKRRQLELLSGGVPIAVQYRRMKERAERISVGRSKIEGWGGYLNESVPAHEMLIEYVGELIRLKLADLRELEYDRRGMGCYMFRVNDEWVVDATMTGGPARFLNHSCDPNCVARIEQVEGSIPRILIYSKRPIEAGAELTYDYKFPLEDNKIPCYCGAPMCRGSMN